jgi:hypothetical protein
VKPIKPQNLWMMRGPGGLAPYFGIAVTKRELIRRVEKMGFTQKRGELEPVRVTVHSSGGAA